MKSLAVVNFSSEPHSVEVREVERPIAGPEDVILKVEAASVCGSDLHQWEGTNSWPVNYPVILGHEFAGVIDEVGDRVTDWKVGDRVVSETAAEVNMHGAMSRQGLYNLDPSRKGFGYGVNGAMTRYTKVASRLLHKIPDSVSFDHASMTEPCSVAYSATIAPGNLRPGDRILVLGPGPIGILAAAMARIGGAEVAIVGLERDKARLEVAKKYGCDVIIGDLASKSPARQIRQVFPCTNFFIGSCVRLTRQYLLAWCHRADTGCVIGAFNHGFFQPWHAGGVMYLQ